MVNKKGVLVLVVALGVLLFMNHVLAGQMMALQGNVKNSSGGDLTSGDLTVEIWDSLSGGSMIYNSTTVYNSNVTNGRYDIMLGEYTTLNLNYGANYYMAVAVDSEPLSFDGAARRRFQPTIGNINSSFLNLTTIDTTGNITSGGWFKGLFNWTVLNNWLSFDGATLNFNETKLNDTVDNRFLQGKNSIFSNLNVTGIANFGGTWLNGGTTIDGGSIFAQTLYVYNVTSLNVDSLKINGSMSPGVNGTFNNTFDLGISGTNVWRYGYFGTDVYVGSKSITQDYVPYSGAVANLDMGAYNVSLNNNSRTCYGDSCNGEIYYNGSSLVIQVT